MDMDTAYEQACECESALEAAVGAEAYQSAAASMEEYRELQAQDPVFGVLKVLPICRLPLRLPSSLGPQWRVHAAPAWPSVPESACMQHQLSLSGMAEHAGEQ